MAWAGNKFRSRQDALERANAVHVCLECRHTQTKIYKICPMCNSKNRQYFMSEGEFHRGMSLLTLQAAGTISEVNFQPPFELHALGGKKIGKYIADFSYKDKEGKFVVEDFKGSRDHIEALSLWKMAHLEAEYGIKVKITDAK